MSSETLRHMLSHWFKDFDEETLAVISLPFNIENFCRENDEKLAEGRKEIGRITRMYNGEADLAWGRAAEIRELKQENQDLKQQISEACAGRDQWRKTHLENQRLRELLSQANAFLELFEAGQKRMRHDLNHADTFEAVSLYHAINKALKQQKEG